MNSEDPFLNIPHPAPRETVGIPLQNFYAANERDMRATGGYQGIEQESPSEDMGESPATEAAEGDTNVGLQHQSLY